MRRIVTTVLVTVAGTDAYSLAAPCSIAARAASPAMLATPDSRSVDVEAVAEGDCGCSPAVAYNMNGVSVTGATLRGMELSDRRGARSRAAQLLGEDGPAVVVFLRHLG